MSKEQYLGEKTCPSGCGILYKTGDALEDVSCPCRKGYWNVLLKQFVSGDEIRNGAPTREQYHHHLRQCDLRPEHEAYYHGKDPEDFELTRNGELKTWGDYFILPANIEFDLLARRIELGDYGKGAAVKAFTLGTTPGWLLRCRRSAWNGKDSVTELQDQTKKLRSSSRSYTSKKAVPPSFSGINFPTHTDTGGAPTTQAVRGATARDSSGDRNTRHQLPVRSKSERSDKDQQSAAKSHSDGQSGQPDPSASLWTGFSRPQGRDRPRRRELTYDGKVIVYQEDNEDGPVMRPNGDRVTRNQLELIIERILALSKAQPKSPEAKPRQGSVSNYAEREQSRHTAQPLPRRGQDRYARAIIDEEDIDTAENARGRRGSRDTLQDAASVPHYERDDPGRRSNPSAIFPRQDAGQRSHRDRDASPGNAAYELTGRAGSRRRSPQRVPETRTSTSSLSYAQRHRASSPDPIRPANITTGRGARRDPGEQIRPRHVPDESPTRREVRREVRREAAESDDEESRDRPRYSRNIEPVQERGERPREKKYRR